MPSRMPNQVVKTCFVSRLAGLGPMLALGIMLAEASAQAAPRTTFTVLYNFGQGASLSTTLVQDAKGNLYGTTMTDGGSGSVFKMDTGRNVTTLYYFTGSTDGRYPNPELALDDGGNLYGTTNQGGACSSGVIFKVTGAGQETVLHNFCSQKIDGGGPRAGLIRDGAGNLYGTTTVGGRGNGGVVFKLDPSGTYTVLYNFRGGADGFAPFAVLTRDSAGNLYGTTPEGGHGGHGNCHKYPPGCGVVFKVDTAGKETILHAFGGGSDGVGPFGGVTLDSVGNLYGTTFIGGNQGCPLPNGNGGGTIYKLDKTGKETMLYRWKANSPSEYDPFAGLVRDQQGNLYGATEYGGNFNCGGGTGCGTIFKLDTRGKLTVLHTFNDGNDGAYPRYRLFMDGQGDLYGANVSGTLFEITP